MVNMQHRADLYSYEEVASIIEADKAGRTALEISQMLGGRRTSGAIGLLLKHYKEFKNNPNYSLNSAVLKKHFTQYLNGATQKKQATESTDDSFQAIQDSFVALRDAIVTHIARKVEEEKQTMQKEIEALRVKAEKWDKAQELFK